MYRDPNRSEVCCISGCEGRNVGRGWCRKHYLRWRKHGDPLAAAYPMDLSCLVCDHEDGDMVTESATGAGQRLNVSRGTVEKHRKADHDNNPEWHAKRAAWWASELSALTATQEQTA